MSKRRATARAKSVVRKAERARQAKISSGALRARPFRPGGAAASGVPTRSAGPAPPGQCGGPGSAQSHMPSVKTLAG